MGTENVDPFLQSLMELSRPERALEVGIGYKSPFLIKGIKTTIEKCSFLKIVNSKFQGLSKIFNEKYLIFDLTTIVPMNMSPL